MDGLLALAEAAQNVDVHSQLSLKASPTASAVHIGTETHRRPSPGHARLLQHPHKEGNMHFDEVHQQTAAPRSLASSSQLYLECTMLGVQGSAAYVEQLPDSQQQVSRNALHHAVIKSSINHSNARPQLVPNDKPCSTHSIAVSLKLQKHAPLGPAPRPSISQGAERQQQQQMGDAVQRSFWQPCTRMLHLSSASAEDAVTGNPAETSARSSFGSEAVLRPQEELIFAHMHWHYGEDWAAIAKHLPQHTADELRALWQVVGQPSTGCWNLLATYARHNKQGKHPSESLAECVQRLPVLKMHELFGTAASQQEALQVAAALTAAAATKMKASETAPQRVDHMALPSAAKLPSRTADLQAAAAAAAQVHQPLVNNSTTVRKASDAALPPSVSHAKSRQLSMQEAGSTSVAATHAQTCPQAVVAAATPSALPTVDGQVPAAPLSTGRHPEPSPSGKTLSGGRMVARPTVLKDGGIHEPESRALQSQRHASQPTQTQQGTTAKVLRGSRLGAASVAARSARPPVQRPLETSLNQMVKHGLHPSAAQQLLWQIEEFYNIKKLSMLQGNASSTRAGDVAGVECPPAGPTSSVKVAAAAEPSIPAGKLSRSGVPRGCITLPTHPACISDAKQAAATTTYENIQTRVAPCGSQCADNPVQMQHATRNFCLPSDTHSLQREVFKQSPASACVAAAVVQDKFVVPAAASCPRSPHSSQVPERQQPQQADLHQACGEAGIHQSKQEQAGRTARAALPHHRSHNPAHGSVPRQPEDISVPSMAGIDSTTNKPRGSHAPPELAQKPSKHEMPSSRAAFKHAVKQQLLQQTNREKIMAQVCKKLYVQEHDVFGAAPKRQAGKPHTPEPSGPAALPYSASVSTATSDEQSLLWEATAAVLNGTEPPVRILPSTHGGTRRVVSMAQLQSTSLGKHALQALQRLLLVPADAPEGAVLVCELGVPVPEQPRSRLCPGPAARFEGTLGGPGPAARSEGTLGGPGPAAGSEGTLGRPGPAAGSEGTTSCKVQTTHPQQQHQRHRVLLTEHCQSEAHERAARADAVMLIDTPDNGNLALKEQQQQIKMKEGAVVPVHADAVLDTAVPLEEVTVSVGSKRKREERCDGLDPWTAVTSCVGTAVNRTGGEDTTIKSLAI